MFNLGLSEGKKKKVGHVKKGSFLHQGVSLIVPTRDNIRLNMKLGHCFSLEGFIPSSIIT